MPELQKNSTVSRVNCFGHVRPADDLLRSMNAWRSGIALPLLRDLGTFGDDEPGGCALHIIFDGQGRPGLRPDQLDFGSWVALTMRLGNSKAPRRNVVKTSIFLFMTISYRMVSGVANRHRCCANELRLNKR